jgi:hypothetical protein
MHGPMNVWQIDLCSNHEVSHLIISVFFVKTLKSKYLRRLNIYYIAANAKLRTFCYTNSCVFTWSLWKGEGKITPKQAYVALKGPGG